MDVTNLVHSGHRAKQPYPYIVVNKPPRVHVTYLVHSGHRVRQPYPYIVVRNALHPCLYDALERSYPSDEEIIALSPVKPAEVRPPREVTQSF